MDTSGKVSTYIDNTRINTTEGSTRNDSTIDRRTVNRNAPFYPGELTPIDRNKTLESVNLIKYKCCGKTKGRNCANGRK